MQHDELIWQVINHQFCSHKSTLTKSRGPRRDTHQFCRHSYSITGLCNRSSCPLANSTYATIREENGRIHLYLKTVERAHSPKNLWEKIYLSRNYAKALAQLDEHLAYFPKAMVHRNKQRLTKIHQYLLRMRKLKLRQINGRQVGRERVHRKVEQREERREKKALVAAKIETCIEKELMERLARGTYGDIYNFPEVPYQRALEKMTEKEEEEEEEEEELDTEDENETDSENEKNVEYVEDLEEEDEEDMEQDLEDMELNAYDYNNTEYDSDSDGDDESEEGENEEDSIEQSHSEDDNDHGSISGREDSGSIDDTQRKQSYKKQQSSSIKHLKRGVRVHIEYEDENEGMQEEEADMISPEAGMAW